MAYQDFWDNRSRRPRIQVHISQAVACECLSIESPRPATKSRDHEGKVFATSNQWPDYMPPADVPRRYRSKAKPLPLDLIIRSQQVSGERADGFLTLCNSAEHGKRCFAEKSRTVAIPIRGLLNQNRARDSGKR